MNSRYFCNVILKAAKRAVTAITGDSGIERMIIPPDNCKPHNSRHTLTASAIFSRRLTFRLLISRLEQRYSAESTISTSRRRSNVQSEHPETIKFMNLNYTAIGGAKSNVPSDLKTRQDFGLPDYVLDR
jgi:hypothetical protein